MPPSTLVQLALAGVLLFLLAIPEPVLSGRPGYNHHHHPHNNGGGDGHPLKVKRHKHTAHRVELEEHSTQLLPTPPPYPYPGPSLPSPAPPPTTNAPGPSDGVYVPSQRYQFPPSGRSLDAWNELLHPAQAGGDQSRYLVDVDGDGNCFYRSLATIVYGTEHAHSQVRRELAAHMREAARRSATEEKSIYGKWTGEDASWLGSIGNDLAEVEKYAEENEKDGAWVLATKMIRVVLSKYDMNVLELRPELPWPLRYKEVGRVVGDGRGF